MARNGSSKKRNRARIPKEERKNLRLWAEGNREVVLNPYLADYAAAMERGTAAERKLWKKICREYHARISWRLRDHEEPVLLPWDPEAPIGTENLPADEEAYRLARIEELNSRIRRWFRYRIRRTQKYRRSTCLDPFKDPYTRVLARLSGLTAPPKARQAYQQFMHESYEEKCAPIVDQRWQKKVQSDPSLRDKKPKVNFTVGIAREIFAALPKAERDDIAARAKTEATDARAAYQAGLTQLPSFTPQARHEALKRLPDFISPILQEIFNVTGCHATLIVGGPMPEYGGEISTQHISFGRNLTAASVHWARWDEDRFTKQVANFFVEYLHTAYTANDCANAALPGTQRGTSSTGQQASSSSAAIGTAPRLASASNALSDSDSEESDDDSSDSDEDSDEEAHNQPGRRKKRRVEETAAPTPHPAPVHTALQQTTPPSSQLVASFSPAPVSQQAASLSSQQEASFFHTPFSQQAAPSHSPQQLPFQTPLPQQAQPFSHDLTWDGFIGGLDNWNGMGMLSGPLTPRQTSSGHVDTAVTPTLPAFPAQNSLAVANSSSPIQEPLDSAGLLGFQNPSFGEPFSLHQTPPQQFSLAEELPLQDSALPATGIPISNDVILCSGNAVTPPLASRPLSSHGNLTISDTVDLRTPHIASDVSSSNITSSVNVTSDTPSGTVISLPIESSAKKRGRPRRSATEGGSVTSTLSQRRNARTLKGLDSVNSTDCPSTAPQWFAKAHQHVTQVDLGAHYNAVLAAWIRMEKASRFEQGQDKLPAKGRPSSISTWMRAKVSPPKIGDVTAFAAAWQQWWDSLQPGWRTKRSDGSWKVEDGYGGKGEEWGGLVHLGFIWRGKCCRRPLHVGLHSSG
ncbi:hypothetical protein MVEN_02212900 [Mycena venus]|uniref:Uncharacterized protein n=1 Tax=Mycena venus TaxID=2733690 RepID=A0A8H6X7M5_9AGAR|nr:hypothetical protein MVEN_02212900 [Mycena venus]